MFLKVIFKSVHQVVLPKEIVLKSFRIVTFSTRNLPRARYDDFQKGNQTISLDKLINEKEASFAQNF